MNTQNIKGKLLSNQIATRNNKKAGQVELARKLAANVRVADFHVLFVVYSARVHGPLQLHNVQLHDTYNEFAPSILQRSI